MYSIDKKAVNLTAFFIDKNLKLGYLYLKFEKVFLNEMCDTNIS